MADIRRPIPRKLDNGMIAALSLAISKGNYAVTACQLCDISAETYYEWLRLAQQDYNDGLTSEDSIYLKLSDSLKKAEADAETRLVQVVRDAAEVKREWLPAMTMLERRHPDRWGRKDRTQVDINQTKVVQITHITEIREPQQVVEGEVKELPVGEE